jgi:hypothetical protein
MGKYLEVRKDAMNCYIGLLLYVASNLILQCIQSTLSRLLAADDKLVAAVGFVIHFFPLGLGVAVMICAPLMFWGWSVMATAPDCPAIGNRISKVMLAFGLLCMALGLLGCLGISSYDLALLNDPTNPTSMAILTPAIVGFESLVAAMVVIMVISLRRPTIAERQ